MPISVNNQCTVTHAAIHADGRPCLTFRNVDIRTDIQGKVVPSEKSNSVFQFSIGSSTCLDSAAGGNVLRVRCILIVCIVDAIIFTGRLCSIYLDKDILDRLTHIGIARALLHMAGNCNNIRIFLCRSQNVISVHIHTVERPVNHPI